MSPEGGEYVNTLLHRPCLDRIWLRSETLKTFCNSLEGVYLLLRYSKPDNGSVHEQTFHNCRPMRIQSLQDLETNTKSNS